MHLSKPEILLQDASPETIAKLSRQLPEFVQPYDAEAIYRRLDAIPHWCYIALIDGQAAGFKVGYERAKDGSFYSWLGGVLPAYRRQGVARILALAMEAWARESGYSVLRFKTRNRHRQMLHFALDQGFDMVGVEAHPTRAENRIWLEKDL